MTKMSQLTINDDAASFRYPFEASYSDGIGDQKARAMNADRFVKRMVESTDKVDKQLLQLLKLRQKSLAVEPKD